MIWLLAFTARQCPACGLWIRCPRIDSRADWNHWKHYHLTAEEDENPVRSIGFPFFSWNEEPMRAEYVPSRTRSAYREITQEQLTGG